MDILRRRITELEALVDIDPEDDPQNQQRVIQSLQQLSQQLDSFIKSHPQWSQLFRNIAQSKVRLHYSDYKLSEDEFTEEKAIVESHLTDITDIAERLITIQKLVNGNSKEFLHVDLNAIDKSQGIQERVKKLQKIELKYNGLLIRSIALLQNYLRLNDNMNNFYQRASTLLKT